MRLVSLLPAATKPATNVIAIEAGGNPGRASTTGFPFAQCRARVAASGKGLPAIAAALCAGAFIGAVSVALLLIAVGAAPPGGGSEGAFVPSNLLFAYFIFLFTAPAALVIGIPSFYLLTCFRMLKWAPVGTVGIVAGTGVGMLLERGVPSSAEMLTFAGIGLICALAALFILLRSHRAPRIPPDEAMG